MYGAPLGELTDKRQQNKIINKIKWAAGLIKNVGDKLPKERHEYLMGIIKENLDGVPPDDKIVDYALSLSLQKLTNKDKLNPHGQKVVDMILKGEKPLKIEIEGLDLK